MGFLSSTVSIGYNTKKSDYDRLLDNTQYNKAIHSSDLILSTRGLDRISLSNFNDSGIPEVKSGSVIENNGTVLSFSSDQSINDSGVANGWVYIKYSVTNSRFEYTVTAPAWDDSKQGYYSSNDRYFFKMYKVGAADFRYKIKFKTNYDRIYPFVNGIYRSYVTQTENTMYDDLTYLLTNIGDFIGSIGYYVTGLNVVGGIRRFDATTLQYLDGSGSVIFAIADGDATTYSIWLYINGFTL